MSQKNNQPQPKLAPAWVNDTSDPEPVVLSTRVRLARNLRNYPFPHTANDSALAEVAQLVSALFSRKSASFPSNFRAIDTAALTDPEKAAYVDSHLVSLAHVIGGLHRIALLDNRFVNSVLINEEDHIRIQTILPGLMPHEAWREANKVDDYITAQLPIAFHSTYGYLTSSLANAGTGMRISVMMHLPALAFIEKLDVTLHAARTLGGTVRGYYGEDGAAHGNVYQVSNTLAVGNEERGIVGRLTSIATFLQSDEIVARHILRSRRYEDVQAVIKNDLWTLEGASALTAEEAMRILSNLRLGKLLGIETSVSHKMFCEMMASMRGSIGAISSLKDRARDIFYEDTRRPALIRNRMRLEYANVTSPKPPLGLPK